MKALQRLAIVCFEDPRQVSGGVQRRVAAEIAYFAQRGAHVVVLTQGAVSDHTAGPVRYISIPTPPIVYPLRTLIFSAKASHYLRHLPAFDVIETHHDAGAATLLAFHGSRPTAGALVEVVHGVFRDEFAAVRRYESLFSRGTLVAGGLLPLSIIEQVAARRATAVVTVSRYTAGQIVRRYGVPGRRTHVIPNGIDTARYTPLDRAARPAAGRDTPCEIVFVGRWQARKGVVYLLRAFAQAYRQHPGLRLKLIGGGPLDRALREESGQLGVTGVVEFLSGLDDAAVIAAYRGADIVCIPSLQEGQGIVALEAQACGAPVVATRAGGLTEAVRDRETGILVPPGAVGPLADALLELAHNGALRRAYGRQAAAWARGFAWDQMLARAEALYGRLPAVAAAL
ncbi:MAG TPA: glycosyltransferase family 4 protein [Chloroflexia bacterium]|nr:glycosyltransferase family 4 protein [Chloroflexia bacterium]